MNQETLRSYSSKIYNRCS